MSYLSKTIGKISRRTQRPHAPHALTRRRALITSALEPLEGRQLLSAVAISNASVNEGGQLVFNVTLNSASDKAVTVNYKAAGGTAKAGRDYDRLRPGKLTFAPGETSKTITLKTKSNNLYSPDKTVFLRLSNAGKGNSLQNKGVGTGKIVNTDAAPTITINNVRTNEGQKGNRAVFFTVKMTGSGSETPIKVNYATQNVTAIAAKGKNSDYNATKGVITFKGKKTLQKVKVVVRGDTTAEANEAFRLNLTPAKGSGVTIVNPDVPDANFAVGSIVNDDGGTVSAGTTVSTFPETVSVNPGGTAGVNIILNQISADPVTVFYSTADGTAVAGTNYTTASGSVTFNPGETSKTVTVDTTTDASGGTFSVSLANPDAGATIATGTSTVTITPIALPSLSVSDVSVTEGDGGVTTATFTVSLSSAAVQPVSLSYATADGTATAGSDYTAASGTLSFAVGESSKTVTVSVLGDTDVEDDETFTLSLSQVVNAPVSKAVGTATIINDDTSGGPITDPTNDGQGLSFVQGSTNTNWSLNSQQGPHDSLMFHYTIASARSTPVANVQLQLFLVPQGSDLNTQTPYRTINLDTIAAGQTLTGTADATGGPNPTGGYAYYARLVSNGVVYAIDNGPPFFST